MEEKLLVKTDIEKKRQRLKVSFLLMLLGSLVLLVTIFAPFASAKKSYKEHLEKHPEKIVAQELNMTAGEAINISLFEFGKMYAKTAQLEISKAVSITCLVIISIFSFLAILTTLFSILKKPICTIIFSLLSFAMFRVIMWDFSDRGVIPNRNYDWGMAEYLCYVGVIVVVTGAIAMLLIKNKEKKIKSGEETYVTEKTEA